MHERAHTSPGAVTRAASRAASRGPRGFTLIELMVVVVLIGILALIAIPSMSGARYDRRVYERANDIAQLVRDARSRAMGRGGATILQFSTIGDSRGQYRLYEAVMANSGLTSAGTDAGVLANHTPDPRCKRGVLDLSDVNSNMLVDAVTLDNQSEIDADIVSQVLNPTGAAAPSGGVATICFTPTGRAYYDEGNEVSFDAALPMTRSFSVLVRRRNGNNAASPDLGLRRRVLVTPSGIARVTAGGKLPTDPS